MHLFLFFIQLNFDRVALMSSFNVFFLWQGLYFLSPGISPLCFRIRQDYLVSYDPIYLIWMNVFRLLMEENIAISFST